MATVVPLAVAASAAAAAGVTAPRVCVFGSTSPFQFLGVCPRLRPTPRGVACALRRRPSKYKTKIQVDEYEPAEDDMDNSDDGADDALEALFKQLEDDLKTDDLHVEYDDDDGISEEDMARFEQELAEAIGDIDGVVESSGASLPGYEGYGNDEKTDETERPELKNWQLKRLAHALKTGRRKTSIKNLAGELGLDRALVIEMLRNPPPKLLLLSASLPDEAPSRPEILDIEPSPVINESDSTKSKPQIELPVHVRSAEWSARKRLKKVQLETLEKVYFRSKRPTNTMISSIVQVTNLPRKTIVKWFEDKREQDGVPDHHASYKRSPSETIASQ